MRRLIFRAAVLAALGLTTLGTSASARPKYFEAPPETARLQPGPGAEAATNHCIVCHSLDYITTQPPKLANPTGFWTAEVAKMKKVYGLKIEDAEQAQVIDYLAKTYR